MTSLTIHTGSMGESTQLFINWADENCVPQEIELEIRIRNQDKPRVLELVHKVPSTGDVILLTRTKGDRHD